DPEVEVLLPEREIEVERPHVVLVHGLRRLGIADLEATHQPEDGVPRHEVGDRPVDRHGHDEGQSVDEKLSEEVAAHRLSSMTTAAPVSGGGGIVLVTSRAAPSQP